MDPLTQLPLECLLPILEALVNSNNCAALAALLQTNRYLATVTLPYLYSDPYRFSTYKPSYDIRPDFVTRARDPLLTRIPTRALLNFLPPPTVLPMVLSLGIQPFDASVSTEPENSSSTTTLASATTISRLPGPLNYLAQIRHLHQQPWAIGLDQLWKWAQPPPGVLAFILTQEFQDLCYHGCLLPTEHWPLERSSIPGFYKRCYQMLFFREASWALARPILKQLQSLSIPFTHIGRYLEPSSMCQLGRLERVHFILDDVSPWDITAYLANRPLYAHNVYLPIVRFVEEHTRSFPGVLKSLETTNAGLWTHRVCRKTCPESVLQLICRMLPPLRRPTSLTTHSSVVQLLEHAEATDLSKLEELDTTMLRHSLFVSGNDEGITSDAQETIFTKQHFILRRCRALRRLKMESLGSGNLRWAVDEKRLVERNGQDTLLPAPFQTEEEGNQPTTSDPEHGREGLVPLEEFEIETVYGRPTDETDLAAIAFSQTLKIIKVYYHGTYGGGRNPTRHRFIKHLSSFVGRQWVHMPLLTHFSVGMGLAGLVIDSQLLLNIPNAISVLLSDETAVYLLEDIDTCLPAYLPSLKSLTLRGLPALSFHPDTLHSTHQLTELSVTAHKTFETHEPDDAFIRFDEDYQDDFAPSACYIPPADELHRSYGIHDESTTSSTPTTTIRPKWTWDWQLPCLVSLALSSEFAFLFQFRMLQGCPALKVLELEMRTATTGSHPRTITDADMFDPQGEQIVAPALAKLRMHGPWAFADLTMALQFLSGMFPSLNSLSAFGWIDFSLRDMVHITRTLPGPIKEIFLLERRWPTKEEKTDLKLVLDKEKYDAPKYKSLIECDTYIKEDVVATVRLTRAEHLLLREGASFQIGNTPLLRD